MPQFDPSVIGSIGDNIPDVPGSIAKGLTLADLYDTNQLSKIKLKETKDAQADMTYAREILRGKDLTKKADQDAAVAEITKRSPKLGMDLMKQFQGGQQSQIELDRGQLELYKAHNDILGGAALPLKQKHDQLIAQGMDEQKVSQAMAPDVFRTVEQLSKAKLPNGQPVLSDDDRNWIRQTFGQGYNAAAVNQLVAQSEQAKKAIDMKLTQDRADRDERRVSVAERSLSERERADKARESLADQKAAARQFGGKEGELLGALADRGVSLPAGLRSQAQMKATLSAIVKRHPDMNVDQMADGIERGQISFGAEKKETQIAAGIAGKIRYAEEEINRLVPLVKEASGQVPRGQFVPWNRLKLYTSSQVSDPQLKKLKAYLTTLSNAYDVLAARGGTDIEKRKHNREMFDAADSPEALDAAMDAVLTEARVSGEAADASTKPRLQPPSSSAPSPSGAAAPPRRPGQGGAEGTPPPPPGFTVTN